MEQIAEQCAGANADYKVIRGNLQVIPFFIMLGKLFLQLRKPAGKHKCALREVPQSIYHRLCYFFPDRQLRLAEGHTDDFLAFPFIFIGHLIQNEH